MKSRAFIVALGLLCASQARAAIVFHTSGEANFSAAMSGAAHVVTEDFEGSTVLDGGFLAFDDPLAQGAPNVAFPGGLSVPVTLQSHYLADPAAASPRGQRGLVMIGKAYWGVPSDTVFPNFIADSLDIIPDVRIAGIGFILSPVSWGVLSADVTVSVYGPGNTLLDALEFIFNPQDHVYLGIQSTAGEVIERVNLNDLEFPGQTSIPVGVDNLRIYTSAPEPATILFLAGGLPMLLRIRRRQS